MERGFGLQLLRVDTMADCRDGATPFDEAKLEGRVLRTIVAGRTVYEYV